ncbi:MAG TPA: response regulator [Candidatus Polarisedimenticolaceae bacterium]|nr:response regulator [Candidatus Polarisedimenticolaceae bacterium]
MMRAGGGSRRRLLAVDDNRLILRVIEDFFVPHAWDVTVCDDARIALDSLQGYLPDAIVSDILMPGMDGWELFEEVRRHPAGSEIPFIFLTVEGELPQRLRGLHLGADDYVTKPFAVEELHARVERLVERRGALEAARRGGDALLSGSVEHLAISDLLQILSLNGKDGTVHLDQDENEGRIDFVGGQIVHAQAGNAQGTKALFRMLGWSAATFRVLPRMGEAPAPTINSATANVIMDGLVSLDEWGRWKDLLPPDEAQLDLAEDARTRLHGHTVSAAEFDVLARAKSGTTVARVLADSPHPDAQVAEAICTLHSRGVVRRRI